MRTFLGFVTGFVMTILIASLVVALITGNWAAVGALILFIGIACPNFAKQAKKDRAKKERELERQRQFQSMCGPGGHCAGCNCR